MSGNFPQDLSHLLPEQGRHVSSQLPLVEALTPCPELEQLLLEFACDDSLLVLDSARYAPTLGRFSYLMCNPLKRFQIQKSQFSTDPFESIRQIHTSHSVDSIPGLPPFQGGFAGLLSYELGQSWEQFARAPHDEFQLPDLAVGFYDWVIAWDHSQHRAWLIVQGFDQSLETQNINLAAQRLKTLKARIDSADFNRQTRLTSLALSTSTQTKKLQIDDLSPVFPLEGHAEILSNFSKTQFLNQVERIIEYIYAGDIFQTNFSQRLLSRSTGHPAELYLNLRSKNAAPFAGYFGWDDWAVVSASPERFLNISHNEVETRPIKGTRRRQYVPEADLLTR